MFKFFQRIVHLLFFSVADEVKQERKPSGGRRVWLLIDFSRYAQPGRSGSMAPTFQQALALHLILLQAVGFTETLIKHFGGTGDRGGRGRSGFLVARAFY